VVCSEKVPPVLGPKTSSAPPDLIAIVMGVGGFVEKVTSSAVTLPEMVTLWPPMVTVSLNVLSLLTSKRNVVPVGHSVDACASAGGVEGGDKNASANANAKASPAIAASRPPLPNPFVAVLMYPLPVGPSPTPFDCLNAPP